MHRGLFVKRFISIGKSANMKKKMTFEQILGMKDSITDSLKANNNIEELLYLWYLPQQIIAGDPLNVDIQNSMADEIMKLRELLKSEVLIKQVKESVSKRNKENKTNLPFEPDSRITLLDMIKYIDNDNFKCLYRAMYTLLATFQTSVFPESIFSMITRTMHTNMNIRTCLNKVHHRSSFIVPSRVVNPSC